MRYNPEWYGSIIENARENNLSSEALLSACSTLEVKLNKYGVSVIESPRYSSNHEFQIDEQDLRTILEAEISYSGKKACDYDVKSIRSIYALRAGGQPRNLESCNAIFVSANLQLVRVVGRWGKIKESTIAISAAISNYELVNTAWLRSPNTDTDVTLPTMCSVAFASLNPSIDFIESVKKELQTLKDEGGISEVEFQMLKSDPRFLKCATLVTLGNTSSFDHTTFSKISERYKDEINKVINKKELKLTTISNRVENISRIGSIVIPILIFAVFSVATLFGNLYTRYPMLSVFCLIAFCAYTFADIVLNIKIPSMRKFFEKKMTVFINKVIGNVPMEDEA